MPMGEESAPRGNHHGVGGLLFPCPGGPKGTNYQIEFKKAAFKRYYRRGPTHKDGKKRGRLGRTTGQENPRPQNLLSKREILLKGKIKKMIQPSQQDKR